VHVYGFMMRAAHSFTDRYQHFRQSCCLHLQDQTARPTQQGPSKHWYQRTKICHHIQIKVKGKVFLLQARCGPEGG
jgi:hypothetical protein